MCGRYAASRSMDELVEELDAQVDATGEPVRSVLKNPQQPPPAAPDYNMAPGKNAPVCLVRTPRGVEGDEGPAAVRQLRLLTWGLVPSWSTRPDGGPKMINARVESVFTTRAYRTAVLRRRLLVPADGWYEWQASPTATDGRGRPRKQPFFIHRGDGDLVAFAGLYEFWRDATAERDDPLAWLATFTILTGAAEPGLDRLHDRQPVVLDRDRWAAWLDPERTAPDEVARILADPGPSGRFAAYPVGRAVGSAGANGPGLLHPADPAELQGVVDPSTGEILDPTPAGAAQAAIDETRRHG